MRMGYRPARPLGPAGRGYYLASDMFGISANTEYPEEAWEFVKYLTLQREMEAYMRIYGRGPVRRPVYPEYAALHSERDTTYHMEGMQDGVLSPETFIGIREVHDMIRSAVIDNIAANKMSPAQAIDEIADAVRTLLDNM